MTISRRRIIICAISIALVAVSLTSVTTPQRAVASGKNLAEASGGKAVAHRDGKRITDPAVTASAPVAKISRMGIDSGEPTIGVTNAGNVFSAAIQTNTRVEVMRSSDRGKSWEIVSPNIAGRNTQLLSLDPYTWVDTRVGDKDSSRIFTIDLTVACAIMSYSDDEGETWVTNPLACGRPVNDHQTLFSGPPASSPTVGFPNIVYYCWNDVASSSCGKSLNGGITWTPTGSPAFAGVGEEGFCGGLHGHGWVGDDGTVYLPREYCDQPYLAISHDEGATWTNVKVAKKVGAGPQSDPSVVTDKAGNIYYLSIGHNLMPYLVISRDGGETWSKPIDVAPPGLREANLPSISANGKGKVAITYMGSYNSPNNPNKPCARENDCPGTDQYAKTTWDGVMTISADVLSKNPTFYTGTVNDRRDPIYRGKCGPGRCGAVYDFIDITVDRQGVAWAAFVDACNMICSTGAAPNLGKEGIVGWLAGGPRLN